MRVEFLTEAALELQAAVQWYDSREPGLGGRFKDAAAGIVLRIQQNPLVGPEDKAGVRRANCRVFPYYLAYVVREETVLILAVAHQRRRPFYWKENSR